MDKKLENIQLSPRKFVAPEYVYGVGARLMAGDFCKKLGGRKILLVTDEGVRNTPWLNELENQLKEQSFDYLVFSSVSSNPRDFEIMDGASIFEENKCNMLLALGGGSSIDCAKGIGIIASNKGHIRDYEGVDIINRPIPPLICIPTTAGSSADVSQFAIAIHSTHMYKLTIVSKAVVPDISLIDPLVLTTMDEYLTACTGLDALSHAIEAFVSNANSAFTDLHAIEAIKLIKNNLTNCLANPEDIQIRGKLMLASMYAGLAFSNASLGCIHSLAHSLGGYTDIPHGECIGMLLPHVVDYNFNASVERYSKVAEIFDIPLKGKKQNEIKKGLTEYLLEYIKTTGIRSTLKDKGVNADIIHYLSKNAINDPCNATNPKPPKIKDLETIYSESL